MKGDFTRLAPRDDNGYSMVLMQQGRPVLDSDWNAKAFLDDDRARRAARDLVGPAGAPRRGGGYLVTPLRRPDGTYDLELSAGRMYVDGVACELRGPATYLGQPLLPGLAPLAPRPGATDLVYLDVWHRHVTALEDPALREPALGGPDTTTRVQVVAQVRVLPDARALPEPPPRGRLTNALREPPEPLRGSRPVYAGLENRLYRVEIHKGDEKGPATFKWSRENGSVAYAVLDPPEGPTTRLRLAVPGHEPSAMVSKGQWVEIADEALDLRQEPGVLARVADVDPAAGVVTLDRALTVAPADRRPRLRRWDCALDKAPEGLPVPADGAAVDLEDGVQVSFSGAGFRTGDHWTFAARVDAREIDRLQEALPDGAERRRAPLAFLRWGEDGTPSVQDARRLFDALTDAGPGERVITVGDGVRSRGECLDVASALRSLPGPGRIVLLEGEFDLEETVDARGREEVVITGGGPGTRVRAPPGRPAFDLSGTRGVTLEHLVIEARDATAAVLAVGARGLVLSRCRIRHGTAPAGPRARPAPDRPAVFLEDAADALVADCALSGSPALVAHGVDLVIARNRLDGGGAWVRGGTRRARLEANRIRGLPGVAVRLGGTPEGRERPADPAVRETSLVGNDIREARGGALSAGAWAGAPEPAPLEDVSIVGNRVEACGTLDAATDPAGLWAAVGVRGGDGVRVVDNEVRLRAPAGHPLWAPVQVVDAARVRVDGNRIVVEEAAPDTYALVLHGAEAGAAANALRGAGLHVADGSDGVVVRHNVVDGAAGHGLVLGGARADLAASGGGLRGVVVHGNRVRHAGGDGIVAPPREGGAPHEDLRLEDNEVSGCARAERPAGLLGGVVLSGVRGLVVRGNRIQDNSTPWRARVAGIHLDACDDFEVASNRVSGPAFEEGAAVSVRGSRGRVDGNALQGGGVWVRGGSADVVLRDNAVHAADRIGIALGGGEGGRLRNVVVVANHVEAAQGRGIATRGPREASPDPRVVGMELRDNHVTRCATGAEDDGADAHALAGIALRGVQDLRVADNRVHHNGAGRAACGVFVEEARRVEVLGNRVWGNGLPKDAQGFAGWQGGVVLVGIRPAEDERRSPLAARVAGNVVASPRGHALLLLARGGIADVHGNDLLTHAPHRQPEGPLLDAGCVGVSSAADAAAPPGRAGDDAGALRFGANRVRHHAAAGPDGPRTSAVRFLAPGHCAWTDNVVALHGEGPTAGPCVAGELGGDLRFIGNRIEQPGTVTPCVDLRGGGRCLTLGNQLATEPSLRDFRETLTSDNQSGPLAPPPPEPERRDAE